MIYPHARATHSVGCNCLLSLSLARVGRQCGWGIPLMAGMMCQNFASQLPAARYRKRKLFTTYATRSSGVRMERVRRTASTASTQRQYIVICTLWFVCKPPSHTCTRTRTHWLWVLRLKRVGGSVWTPTKAHLSMQFSFVAERPQQSHV